MRHWDMGVRTRPFGRVRFPYERTTRGQVGNRRLRTAPGLATQRRPHGRSWRPGRGVACTPGLGAFTIKSAG